MFIDIMSERMKCEKNTKDVYKSQSLHLEMNHLFFHSIYYSHALGFQHMGPSSGTLLKLLKSPEDSFGFADELPILILSSLYYFAYNWRNLI